jgi:hypothetical protein
MKSMFSVKTLAQRNERQKILTVAVALLCVQVGVLISELIGAWSNAVGVLIGLGVVGTLFIQRRQETKVPITKPDVTPAPVWWNMMGGEHNPWVFNFTSKMVRPGHYARWSTFTFNHLLDPSRRSVSCVNCHETFPAVADVTNRHACTHCEYVNDVMECSACKWVGTGRTACPDCAATPSSTLQPWLSRHRT